MSGKEDQGGVEELKDEIRKDRGQTLEVVDILSILFLVVIYQFYLYDTTSNCTLKYMQFIPCQLDLYENVRKKKNWSCAISLRRCHLSKFLVE